MTDNSTQTKKWSLAIAVLLLSIGMGIAVFVYRSTTQIREALAEEILEQQHDVASTECQRNFYIFEMRNCDSKNNKLLVRT